ncbi:MAG: 3-dehydroquinate synthase, partial [Chloroflexota bacterium]|nr:3-dehydroquinate synthase [Chloroflexota bacterium]
RPETIYTRLMIDSGKSDDKVVRPLLAVPDPLERITSLKESRQSNYAKCDWAVHTDKLTLEEVASEVIHGWDLLCRNEIKSDWDTACIVTTATASYPVFVGWGLLDTLGERMKKAGLNGNALVISEDHVFPLYGDRVQASLQKAGFAIDSFVIPHGEKSKTIEIANRIYDFLVQHRAERNHIIVALGGGLIGDVAGFVAATFLRGMPLVHVPTSLMAMVDSSIGGKVAINHPEGKNLIGAFYQPRLVLADVQTLITLPQRELTSGWAEVIKHGLIRDADYFRFLERNTDKLTKLDKASTTEAIKRSAAIKAAVVSEDEKEAGLRMILNYGHTIAHGLETAAGYGEMLHGEAVAVGMMGAARIAERLNLLEGNAVKQQTALLQKFNLPVTYPGADLESIMKTIELDKKVQAKAVRWVLLQNIGKTVIRNDVLPDLVRTTIKELIDSKQRYL